MTASELNVAELIDPYTPVSDEVIECLIELIEEKCSEDHRIVIDPETNFLLGKWTGKATKCYEVTIEGVWIPFYKELDPDGFKCNGYLLEKYGIEGDCHFTLSQCKSSYVISRPNGEGRIREVVYTKNK